MKSIVDAEKEARKSVNDWATKAATYGWIPGSQFLLADNDLKMINGVAKIFEVENYNIPQLTATIAASFASKTVTQTLLDSVPVAGWIVKSGTAAAITKGIGEVVIKYFKGKTALA
jgi:uncharacterized protein (DUF697 family)